MRLLTEIVVPPPLFRAEFHKVIERIAISPEETDITENHKSSVVKARQKPTFSLQDQFHEHYRQFQWPFCFMKLSSSYRLQLGGEGEAAMGTSSLPSFSLIVLSFHATPSIHTPVSLFPSPPISCRVFFSAAAMCRRCRISQLEDKK